MKQALDGLRCQGGHEHVPCAGSETARSAFYPEQICNAIHDGLDAHESAHAMPATGTHVKPFGAWVPGSMSVPGECLLSAGSCIGAVGDCIGADSVTTCAETQNPLTLGSAAVTVFESEAGTRNPLTLSSAAVTVCEPGGNHPSVDVLDKARKQTKRGLCPSYVPR